MFLNNLNENLILFALRRSPWPGLRPFFYLITVLLRSSGPP